MFKKIYNFFDGKKTYTTASVMIGHQVLKVAGLDIPEQSVSIAIDVVLSILTMVFRKIAKV